MNPTYPLLVTLTLLFVSQRTQSNTEDPQYAACKPFECGGLTIRYPFYVTSRHPSYCGLPEYGVSCSDANQTTINFYQNNFVINNIFYEESSVNATYSAFSGPNLGCSPSIHNLNLPAIDPDLKKILLFQNCSRKVANRSKEIKCSESELDLLVYEEDLNQGEFLKYCRDSVVVAYEGEGNGSYSDIDAVLRKGVVVKYVANNCSGCIDSGGRCGFNSTTSEILCFCHDQPYRSSCRLPARGTRWEIIIASAISGFVAFILLILVIIYSRRGKIRASNLLSSNSFRRDNKNVENALRSYSSINPKRYTYSDIRKMTRSFAEKLGEGGFGGVYKGKLLDGRLVAVKLLKGLKGNGEGFINEVASIGRTNHVNVVNLLGFCFEGNKRALVYEYISNGSLEKFIHGDSKLPLETLFQVVLGVARGLEYLHRGCQTRILHFDIKPHNILLDEEFRPKISDFGLAKLAPQDKQSKVSMSGARGTVGYIAPEVFCRSFGDVSHKSDVYSYGMMVLEAIGSRTRENTHQVDSSSEQCFPRCIYKQLKDEDGVEVDISMDDKDKDLKRKILMVSLWCIQPVPSSRPSMSRVVQMLEGSLESIDVPMMPSVSSPPRIQWDPSITSTMSVSVTV